MNLVFSFILSFFVMTLAWQVYIKMESHMVADLFRPLAIFLVSVSHLFLHGWSAKSNVAFYLLIFWALKRGFFTLVNPMKEEQVDFYYSSFIQNGQFGGNSILAFYLTQGLYAWILALPFFFIAKQTSYSWFDVAICLFIFTTIVLGAVADMNLYFFRKKSKGLNQQGLWGLCRHPNYFFAWLTWVGFSILGLYNFVSLISLFSCLLLFFIVRFFYLPIGEKYLLARSPIEYAKYQKVVPMFFPTFL